MIIFNMTIKEEILTIAKSLSNYVVNIIAKYTVSHISAIYINTFPLVFFATNDKNYKANHNA